MKFTNFIRERFPDYQNLIGLYALIVLMVYSWTLFTSFYKLPSWMLHFTTIQIIAIFAYAFSLNLLESLFVLFGLFFLNYTIFVSLKNREEFQARSFLTALVLLASSMQRLILFQEYSDVAAFVSGEFTWWITTITIGLPLVILIPKIKKVRDLIRNLADRATIFLYVYLPLSFISILIIIIRNIS